jgi:hypothetical protein
MSNLLSQASLVMIPSGYKEDVVYSAVPTNGNGDLSFTRASNGTRINSAGLVEVCPWNLAQYSEEFNNAIYTVKNAITIVENSTTAPNGTSTADLIYPNSSGTFRYVAQILSQSTNIYTTSIYAKAQNKSVIWMYMDDSDTNGIVYFDLSDGTMSVTAGSSSTPIGTMTAVGNGWYRCTFTTGANTSLSSGSGFGVCDAKGSAYATASGTNGVYLWGYQANIGSTAKPYFPTTDRLNVPRLTYQNGGGGCPSLLLEKQSTNLQTYSQDFTNVAWTKLGQGVGDTAVVTANYAISPDGTQNATRFVCNLNGGTTSSDRSWMIANFTAQATSTISIWIKLNSAGTKTVLLSDSGGGTKTISGTDWQRIDATFVGAGGEFRIGLIGGSTSDTLDCCIWGAQAESGSYPTSYIPTTSSSATRVADLSTSDTIQTAQTFAGDFTIFADFVPFIDSNDGNGMMVLGGGASGLGATYQSYLWFIGSNVYLSGDSEVNIIARSYSMVVNQRVKIALTRVGTTVKMFVNGAQVGASATSSTSITIRSIGWSYNLPTYQTKGKINQIVLSATGFSDADCQSLTTI